MKAEDIEKWRWYKTNYDDHRQRVLVLDLLVEDGITEVVCTNADRVMWLDPKDFVRVIKDPRTLH